MMTASVAEDDVTAAANAFGYPFSSIAGIRIDPSAATSATADPLISAKKSEALIVTIDSPPRMNPTMAEANAIRRRLIPEAFMIAPARMNSGMAISGNEVAPSNMTRAAFGSAPTPSGPVIIAITATSPRAIAMGMPSTTRSQQQERDREKAQVDGPPVVCFVRGCRRQLVVASDGPASASGSDSSWATMKSTDPIGMTD